MIEHPDGHRTPVIDASVHIFAQSNKDLRSLMREPFTSRGFPDYEMDWYGAPGGEYARAAIPARIRRWWRSICLTSAASTWRSCTR
jgi:hypothetical protein